VRKRRISKREPELDLLVGVIEAGGRGELEAECRRYWKLDVDSQVRSELKRDKRR